MSTEKRPYLHYNMYAYLDKQDVPQPKKETVEEYLARGGKIKKPKSRFLELERWGQAPEKAKPTR